MAVTVSSERSGSGRWSLDPKLDVVFKMLFSAEKNRPVLISLLTAVLRPESVIESAEVLNPEIDKKEWDAKGTLLDLRVRFADGCWADVEMQARREGGLRQRALFYWARMYAAELRAGQAYTALAPVYVVFVLGFNELPTDRLHSAFEVRERHEGYRLSPALELHFLELCKLGRVDAGREDREVVYWCRFFAAQTDEELEQLAMDHPEMRPAKEALDELSSDPKARQLAEDRALWHWIYDSGMAAARQEGREEGEAIGRRAVLALCRALKVELTPERVGWLERAGAAELEALLEVLESDRRWPE